MAVMFDINDTRTALKLPEQQRERASRYVRESNRDDAPFAAMYDFWFAAIAWAVAYRLEPVEPGKEFVSAGGGDKNIQLRSWQVTLLIATYLAAHQRDRLEADAEGGIEGDPVGVSVSAKEVVEHANRLAAAGAKPLLDALRDAAGSTMPPNWAAAKVLMDLNEKVAAHVQQDFPSLVRPVFGAPGLPPESQS